MSSGRYSKGSDAKTSPTSSSHSNPLMQFIEDKLSEFIYITVKSKSGLDLWSKITLFFCNMKTSGTRKVKLEGVKVEVSLSAGMY